MSEQDQVALPISDNVHPVQRTGVTSCLHTTEQALMNYNSLHGLHTVPA